MREIKFRIWDKVFKRMIQEPQLSFPHHRGFFWYGPSDRQMRSDLEAEIMQYTGLKDKNGKEIYEGDIVAGRNAPDYVKSIVRIGESETEVDFGEYSISKPYYGVYLEGSIDLEERLLRGEMSVLGNIYDNPELVASV